MSLQLANHQVKVDREIAINVDAEPFEAKLKESYGEKEKDAGEWGSGSRVFFGLGSIWGKVIYRNYDNVLRYQLFTQVART